MRLRSDVVLFPYCRQIPFFLPLSRTQVSKPDMISQLEQGTEPWTEESCVPVGSMEGEQCVTTEDCSPAASLVRGDCVDVTQSITRGEEILFYILF